MPCEPPLRGDSAFPRLGDTLDAGAMLARFREHLQAAGKAACEILARCLSPEWDEFGTLDLARVAATMNIPMLLDGRNAIAPSRAREAGFHYVGVGCGESLVYHLRIPAERRPGSANSPSWEGSDA